MSAGTKPPSSVITTSRRIKFEAEEDLLSSSKPKGPEECETCR